MNFTVANLTSSSLDISCEGGTLTFAAKLNGQISLPSFINFNNLTLQFTVLTQSVADLGTYNIAV